MKDGLKNQLKEVFNFIHSLTSKNKRKENRRNRIMSFSGIFNEFSNEDYNDFIEFVKKERSKIVDRNSSL
jgi:hypothetical protein